MASWRGQKCKTVPFGRGSGRNQKSENLGGIGNGKKRGVPRLPSAGGKPVHDLKGGQSPVGFGFNVRRGGSVKELGPSPGGARGGVPLRRGFSLGKAKRLRETRVVPCTLREKTFRAQEKREGDRAAGKGGVRIKSRSLSASRRRKKGDVLYSASKSKGVPPGKKMAVTGEIRTSHMALKLEKGKRGFKSQNRRY